MKGYKVFNPDWTCRGFRYEVGKTYEIKDEPALCKRGFHFCERLSDCFKFYDFTPENKVAEVEALGEVISDGCKSCTNKISILRELSWDEVLRTVNTGSGCAGLGNSGDYNTGSHNTGRSNTGDCNTGDRNTGVCNAGNCNTGNRNAGNCNTGDCNTGNRNAGDWNSGDFNATDYSSGCFNTRPDKIRMFNRPTSWTLRDWRLSEACAILAGMPMGSEWVAFGFMTDEEKAKHPEAETTGGFLKETDNAMRQEWWDGLSDSAKATVKSIPNFDAEIFEEITGIFRL